MEWIGLLTLAAIGFVVWAISRPQAAYVLVPRAQVAKRFLLKWGPYAVLILMGVAAGLGAQTGPTEINERIIKDGVLTDEWRTTRIPSHPMDTTSRVLLAITLSLIPCALWYGLVRVVPMIYYGRFEWKRRLAENAESDHQSSE